MTDIYPQQIDLAWLEEDDFSNFSDPLIRTMFDMTNETISRVTEGATNVLDETISTHLYVKDGNTKVFVDERDFRHES